jgi:hypothetical protein
MLQGDATTSGSVGTGTQQQITVPVSITGLIKTVFNLYRKISFIKRPQFPPYPVR